MNSWYNNNYCETFSQKVQFLSINRMHHLRPSPVCSSCCTVVAPKFKRAQINKRTQHVLPLLLSMDFSACITRTGTALYFNACSGQGVLHWFEAGHTLVATSSTLSSCPKK